MTNLQIAKIKNHLHLLQNSHPDIEASAVISTDGFSLASEMPPGVEEDRISAMSAAILSLGERIAKEVGKGTLNQLFIKGDDGFVILMSVGADAVLTALAPEQAKLGSVFVKMRKTALEISKVMA